MTVFAESEVKVVNDVFFRGGGVRSNCSAKSEVEVVKYGFGGGKTFLLSMKSKLSRMVEEVVK